jgi:hypothetical protein
VIQVVGRFMKSTSYKCNYQLALLFTFDRCLFCRTQAALTSHTSPNTISWHILYVWKFSGCKQLGLLVKIQTCIIRLRV